MKAHHLTLGGGLLAVLGGIAHPVVAAVERREVWSQIVDDGLVNTVTLEPTAEQLPVAEAFWFSPGSFGIPLFLLGVLVIWLTRRGQRVPSWLGFGITAWAFFVGLMGGFDAGAMALILIGVLLSVGGRRALDPDESAEPASHAGSRTR